MSETTPRGQEYEQVLSGASQTVAQFDDHKKGFVSRLQHFLHSNPSMVPLIVLVISTLGLGLYIDWEPIKVMTGMARLEDVNNGSFRFFAPFTLSLILQQVQIVGVLALAQTLIILTAGIDLSVGAIAVLCSVIMGKLTFDYGLPPFFSILLGLAFGTGIGAVSGYLVSRVKLPPFIVTLGMWQIVLAANYLYSANETIRSQDIEASAPLLQFLGTSFAFGSAKITLGVVAMLVLALILAYALRSTAWGRHVYAVGDDPEAAELAGVDVHKTLMSVYMLAGFICAFTAWVMIGRFGSVSPSASTGVLGNIQSITAVVIGGISLFGGRGSILGALFGALIVGVFELGLRMAGADSQWTYLLIGFLIIAAVSVDQWIRKVSG
ncbi:ABC transporter permease [Thetidibacter halocola]|uniref:ABC transporter permease n=1 Tax=Thetidibacter halocola TaxID=2827239 RepID=A0A8J7WCA6_9RHOB|nr:ABC transporter permease [Thetidibacter halocola]MBS0124975.1 ABC transporter permease [Thetidibacter halocola]